MRYWPRNTAPFFVALTLMILSQTGCAVFRPATPAYEFHRPTWTAKPEIRPCQILTSPPQKTTCVSLVAMDFITLMVELESACIALGHTEADCKIIEHKP